MKASTGKIADTIIETARGIYGDGEIPLHRPVFTGNESKYLLGCIKSGMVSSIGPKVVEFEDSISKFTQTRFAVATVNGTAALHISLVVAGVQSGDEVITQALTFVATANAISYAGASPVFLDVDQDTLGLSPNSLRAWLERNVELKSGRAINKFTGARVSACVPMHTFGLPLRINEISRICEQYGIKLIEDAAESLGSKIGHRHVGSFGLMAAISFNGNKIITTGGGGMVLTNDKGAADKLRHLTTTAKFPHKYEYVHDQVGFNYRMPNVNASIGLAQFEQISRILVSKAKVAEIYGSSLSKIGYSLVRPIVGSETNNWLNAIILESKSQRDEVLRITNESGVLTRPIWELMSELPMYKQCQKDDLTNSAWLAARTINVPSSPVADWYGEI